MTLAVVLALVLAACTAGSENSPAGTSRTTLELALGSTGQPPEFAPYTGHGGKTHVYSAMLMPLLWVNDENELYSESLDSWDVSDDGLTVTLTLRKGIEWSDGTPMTSTDVVMSLTQYLDPNISGWAQNLGGVTGQSAYADGTADSISGLSAPDDYTVVIELDAPSPWLQQLASLEGIVILPAHILGDVPHEALKEHEYFQTFPVTNGPYKFVKWVADQYVELERNDAWSLGEAGFERVFFKYVEGQQKIAQLETGEVQYVLSVAPSDVERLETLDNIEVQSAHGVQGPVWHLMYQEPLLDKRVRQAMAHAIDRQTICETVMAGFCSVQTTNIPQIGPEWAIPTDDLSEYEYDPERARELLDEARWDPNNELTMLNWFGADAEGTTTIEIAQGNMADVGINWKIENIEIPTWLERVEQQPESFNGTVGAGGNFTIDPSVVRPMLLCDSQFPAGQNVGRYCNEDLDGLLNAGQTETDQGARSDIYREAFRTINEEVPAIYLYVQDEIVAHDSRLQGVKPHGLWSGQFWNIGEWYWEE